MLISQPFACLLRLFDEVASGWGMFGLPVKFKSTDVFVVGRLHVVPGFKCAVCSGKQVAPVRAERLVFGDISLECVDKFQKWLEKV